MNEETRHYFTLLPQFQGFPCHLCHINTPTRGTKNKRLSDGVSHCQVAQLGKSSCPAESRPTSPLLQLHRHHPIQFRSSSPPEIPSLQAIVAKTVSHIPCILFMGQTTTRSKAAPQMAECTTRHLRYARFCKALRTVLCGKSRARTHTHQRLHSYKVHQAPHPSYSPSAHSITAPHLPHPLLPVSHKTAQLNLATSCDFLPLQVLQD